MILNIQQTKYLKQREYVLFLSEVKRLKKEKKFSLKFLVDKYGKNKGFWSNVLNNKKKIPLSKIKEIILFFRFEYIK